MLFIDRFDNQSVVIETCEGEQIRIEVIGTTETGAIRIGFDGPKEVFKITRLNKVDRAHYNLKKKEPDLQPKNNSSKFPSDHVGGGFENYDDLDK